MVTIRTLCYRYTNKKKTRYAHKQSTKKGCATKLITFATSNKSESSQIDPPA